jgi:hypothetical protein
MTAAGVRLTRPGVLRGFALESGLSALCCCGSEEEQQSEKRSFKAAIA